MVADFFSYFQILVEDVVFLLLSEVERPKFMLTWWGSVFLFYAIQPPSLTRYFAYNPFVTGTFKNEGTKLYQS